MLDHDPLGAEAAPHAVGHGGDVGRRGRRPTAALGDLPVGVGADDGNAHRPVACQRQPRALFFNGTVAAAARLRLQPLRSPTRRGHRAPARRRSCRPAAATRPLPLGDDHSTVDVALVDGVGQRLTRLPGPASRGRGRRWCRGRGAGGEPVGDDHAVLAPLVPQDGGEQPGVLAAPRAVEPVVGGHGRPGPGVGAGRARRAAGAPPAACARRARTRFEAGRPRVVGHEVLHARGPAGLQPPT